MPSVLEVPLHRLVKRRHLAATLSAFEALVPGAELALMGVSGELAAGRGRWEIARLGELLAQDSDPGQVQQAGNTLLLPLSVNGRLAGGLLARESGGAPSPALARLLRALGDSLSLLLSEALAKRELARETLDRYQEINLLYRAAKSIGATLEPGQIPHLVLEEIRQIVPADVGAVIILGPDPVGQLEAARFSSPANASFGRDRQLEALLEAARSVCDHALETARPLIVNPPPDPAPGPDDEGIGVLLCAPLKSQDRPLGLLILGRAPGRPEFTAGDEKLVMALTDQAAIAIETARLHKEEVKNQRLEEELAIGQRIQRSFLPHDVPSIQGWEFCSFYRAARQVGGDFYDFIFDPGDPACISLIIADVTGKGVPAALFMASCLTLIRAESALGRGPAAILQRTNNFVSQELRHGLFLTALYGTLDTRDGRFTYASGGHDWPMWQRAGSGAIEFLAAKGYLLGAFRDPKLQERHIVLSPGDQLLFYTDGITEARSPDGEFFGEERLQETMRRHRDASANQLTEAIVNAVSDFSGDAPQSDDLTFFVVRRVE